MTHHLTEQLDCIASALRKTDENIYTKTDENRAIARSLLTRFGWGYSLSYIANLRNEVQVDLVGAGLRDKIDQLHKILCKPKKAKKKPDKRNRPVQVYCTGSEYKQMLEFDTRERAERLLEKK